MDGEDTLTEKHIRLDKEGKAEPENVGEIYRYSIDDNDKLVLVIFLFLKFFFSSHTIFQSFNLSYYLKN